MAARKILTREDVLRAMSRTLSNRAAAKYLGVSYPHYKQYASSYKDENGVDLYTKHRNPSGKGIPKFSIEEKAMWRHREPPIAAIVEGTVPATHYNPQKLKYLLITRGFLEPECSCCGFKEKRLVDGRSPLILRHLDGNKSNWHLDNLKFVCYNCAFLEASKDCPVTEEYVEKEEDFVEKFNMHTDETWELTDYQKNYLKSLGLEPEQPKKPYEKYISRI